MDEKANVPNVYDGSPSAVHDCCGCLSAIFSVAVSVVQLTSRVEKAWVECALDVVFYVRVATGEIFVEAHNNVLADLETYSQQAPLKLACTKMVVEVNFIISIEFFAMFTELPTIFVVKRMLKYTIIRQILPECNVE